MNMEDALYKAIAKTRGESEAEAFRTGWSGRTIPGDVVDVDDSDFEPDPYFENDDFQSEADARDMVWHD